ncbi:MAG: hypothetical protein AB1730_16255 [Myxococcota bacterium]|jgi:hypothetical protein
MLLPEAVDDLSRRWRRARLAAARAVTGAPAASDDEAALTACASETDPVELHRRLFENSARLGGGFVRFHRHRVTLDELPGLLSALDSPCLAGARWEAVPGEPTLKGTRPPCRTGCDSATCDAWREAIDGLVVGLTGEGRHTRTASAGHGQPACVDVITLNPESAHRYGELPGDALPVLERVQRFVRRFDGTDVRFLGVSEGVLLYQLRVSGCGDTRGAARAHVEATLAKKLPHLGLRELSPRPVLDDSTASPTTEGPQ